MIVILGTAAVMVSTIPLFSVMVHDGIYSSRLMARPNLAYSTTLSSFIPFSHSSAVVARVASWAVMSS